jgi:hypothetical protein
MVLGYDITHYETINTIDETIVYLLENMGVNHEHINYLDYDIEPVDNDIDNIKVIANNIITALWFSGIMPLDCDLIYKNNQMQYNGKLYKFDKQTKKLTWSIIKE